MVSFVRYKPIWSNAELSVAEQLNIVKPQTIDYKTLTVSALRELAETSGLIEKGDKKNKKELIKLLEESV